MICNGLFDPIRGYAAFYDFHDQLFDTTSSRWNGYGINYKASIDSCVFNSMSGPHNCLDQLVDCNSYPYATNSSNGAGDQVCSAADTFCLYNLEYPFDNVFGRDEYEIEYLVPTQFPYTLFEDYLNTEKVQSAIGAFTKYSSGSAVIGAAIAAIGNDARKIGVRAQWSISSITM